jgi:hypothetical protein
LALVNISCRDDGWFVSNDQGPSVPVALSIDACNLLVKRDFGLSDPNEQVSYETGVKSGLIVMLRNGTHITQGDLLDFKDGFLTRSTSSGPVTAGEQARQHLVEYMWAIVNDGPQKGHRVCVSRTTLHGKYPPL